MARENFHIRTATTLPMIATTATVAAAASTTAIASVRQHTFVLLLKKEGKPIKVTTYYNSNRNNEASIF